MEVMKRIKHFLVLKIKKVFPSIYWSYKSKGYENDIYLETELQVLPLLCKKNMISIDIGAAGGLYLYHMDKYSASCIAFEPIPAAANDIKNLAKCRNLNATVERVALSDKSGEVELRMLKNDWGRSTIEEENVLNDGAGGKHISIKVPMRKLDDYKFENVGMIKIDVEGHEFSTLQGAAITLQNCHPAIVIEIEERHKLHAIDNVNKFLTQLGYHGFFILNKKFNPIQGFNINSYQDPGNIGNSSNNYARSGIYINNFVFVNAQEVPNLLSFSVK